MLARVQWYGDRYGGPKNTSQLEHGTLLQIVYEGHRAMCFIAWDGDGNAHTRGKIIKKEYQHVVVTTWFRW